MAEISQDDKYESCSPILMYPFISYYMHCGNSFTGTIKSKNNIGIIGDDMGIN